MSDEYVNLNDDNAHEEGTKTHEDYIYNIGEFPVKQDNLQKFRNTYSTSRAEYSTHAFKAKIGGETHTVRVPRNVAREIHLLCEARGESPSVDLPSKTPTKLHQRKCHPTQQSWQDHGRNGCVL